MYDKTTVSPSILAKEFSFVMNALEKYSHYGEARKIEFIKAFRSTAGYSLKDAKDIVFSYVCYQDQNKIYDLLANQCEIPVRHYPIIGPEFDSNVKVKKEEKYLIVSDDTDIKHAYTAHSKDEAKRFAEWLSRQGHFGIKTYIEVNL